MTEAITVALITGGLSLIGVIIASIAGNRRTEQKIQVAQAVTDTKIDELTREVRKHNGFAEKIRTAVPELTVVPVEETRPGWVARHLAHASAAWVSQDSVSMVYEALGSGAPVGILSVPRRHDSRKSRILSGLETLEKEGMVTGYSDWKKQNFRLTAPGSPLLEADRAADYILSRFFPQLRAL